MVGNSERKSPNGSPHSFYIYLFTRPRQVLVAAHWTLLHREGSFITVHGPAGRSVQSQ